MLLRVREIASLFSVSEDRIFNWINRENLPARQVNEIYGANTTEIIEWAISRRRRISAAQFSSFVVPKVATEMLGEGGDSKTGDDKASICRLFAAGLAAGGIVPVAAGASLADVFYVVAERLEIGAAERAELVDVMTARERLVQTPAGNGVAVPHPRYPLLMNLPQPVILVGQLDRALEMGAADKQPIDLVFFLCCRTMAEHLLLLAALSEVLGDDGFVSLIRERASLQKLLEWVKVAWGV